MFGVIIVVRNGTVTQGKRATVAFFLSATKVVPDVCERGHVIDSGLHLLV